MKYTEKDIDYKNIVKTQITTGFPISNSEYITDNDGNILQKPDPLINAIDINWGGANILDSEINTTSDLLSLIKSGIPGGGGSTPSDMISTMLAAIYALQNEVIRLRNSFRFGINSYTEDDFRISETVADLANTEEQEPLWATDEAELSFVNGLDLTQDNYDRLTPVENYSIIPNSKIAYTYGITWESGDVFDEITDSKIFFYLTVSSKNIIFNLKDANNNTIHVNVNDIYNKNHKPDKYNIMFVISRKVDAGKNFLWLAVSDWGTGELLIDGYLDETGNIDEQTSDTPIYFDSTYNLENIEFVGSESEKYIFKLDVYSRYQDFSSTIEGVTPKEPEEYKYKAASITIRSASTQAKLEANKKKYLNNELIFCEATNNLYIYTNGNLINIGRGGGSDSSDDTDNMENYEIIKALAEQGLISIEFINNYPDSDSQQYAESNIKSYELNKVVKLNDIHEINFINDDTDKKFIVKMNPYGEFDIKEEDTNSMAKELKLNDGANSIYAKLPDDFMSDRSFVSLYKGKRDDVSFTTDMKLLADRIQIAAVYAPLKTDTIFGCSHAYIELSNTSDEDFYLDGSFLHYSYTDDKKTESVSNVGYQKLALDGFIPAGGTYLIRGKKYITRDDDPNTFIHVDSYDKEWYVDGELIDLSMTTNGSYGFALTYGDTIQGPNNTQVAINPASILAKPWVTVDNGIYSSKGEYAVVKGFIDSFYIGGDWGKINHWVPGGSSQGTFNAIKSNCIYKLTFELDPAKQAFNSLTKTDSSRSRWQSRANDFQTLDLNNEYISYPKTIEKKAVADYTPKASYEHKNVITDKTKLDRTKPNAIVCSYGINPYQTRCFNWVSSGAFDEAVVIIDPTGKEYIFESYKNLDFTNKSLYGASTSEKDTDKKEITYTFAKKVHAHSDTKLSRKEFDPYITNIVYGSGYKINNIGKSNESYEYGLETKNVGKRLYNLFPGNNEPYTSHKCIVDVPEATTSPVTYKYYICRLNNIKTGAEKLDKSYMSDIRTFTMYPKTYSPRIYQITDQQGFHWIEYQVWAAAAEKLSHEIENNIWNHDAEGNRTTAKGIMPIIINTGDCVQSGARVNEWLDYFTAGDYIFKNYEQMNIVGNNDLCDTNVNALGTGDDIGKSNGYFFHIFNCYEINPEASTTITYSYEEKDGEISSETYKSSIYNKTYMPIVKNIYVPSLYYLDVFKETNEIRILCINSEITRVNCSDWFKLKNDEGYPVNIYTGFTINTGVAGYKQSYEANSLDFTPIYDILYQWTDESKTYLPLCHEMPFTVVTNGCLSWTKSPAQYSRFRSISDAKTGALIGCHCNQIDAKDTTRDGNDNHSAYGLHWLSRLFEHRGISLCLGGHKHTYACTYPARENYLYTVKENGVDVQKWSYKDGPMPMEATLKNDSAEWMLENAIGNKTINLSKLPIIIRPDAHKDLDGTSYTDYDNYKYEYTIVDGGKTKNITLQGNVNKIIIEKLNGSNWEEKLKATDNWSIARDGTLSYGGDIEEIVTSMFDLGSNGKPTITFNVTIAEATGDQLETHTVNYAYYKLKDEFVIYEPDNREESDISTYYESGADKYRITPIFTVKDEKITYTYVERVYSTALTENLVYAGETVAVRVTEQDTLLAPKRFFPMIDKKSTDKNNFVIYMMSQATGYKLTSNKELPSEYQKFSMVIPKSYIDTAGADKPSSDQQMPMFAIIDLLGNNTYAVKYGRISNISKSNTKMTFTQADYGKNAAGLEYLIMSTKSINGLWCKYGTVSKKVGDETITYTCYTQTDTHGDSKVSLYGDSGDVKPQSYYADTEFDLTGDSSTNGALNKLLYPGLIQNENIYLFKVTDKGNMSATL